MKKKLGIFLFTCIISLWWNLSVFLTNGIDFENTVQNKFLYVVCAILARAGYLRKPPCKSGFIYYRLYLWLLPVSRLYVCAEVFPVWK